MCRHTPSLLLNCCLTLVILQHELLFVGRAAFLQAQEGGVAQEEHPGGEQALREKGAVRRLEAQGLNCAAAADPMASGPKRRGRPHAPARSGSRCLLPRGCMLLQSLHAAPHADVQCNTYATRCMGLFVGCRKQFLSRVWCRSSCFTSRRQSGNCTET